MRPRLEPLQVANLIWLDEIDSTNMVAARLVAAWAEDEEGQLADTVLVAARQGAGRGRGARTWESPLGGLYATWLGWLPSDGLAHVPLAVVVSLAEAIEAMLPGLSIGIKWPNDLVVDGRKLAGALCQSRVRGDSCWVAAGVGVNVGTIPELVAGDPVLPTCLAALGWDGSVEEAVWHIVGGFMRRVRAAIASPAAVRAELLARSVHREGDPMVVSAGDAAVAGAFAGFGGEGQLRLDVGGEVRSIASGELVGELPEVAD